MTATALKLNAEAERISSAAPPLLVEAMRIASTVILGVHGRKRAGPGENFWQYRPYSFGDPTARVDWHKSARSDRVFIRENEWEAANTLWVWPSPSLTMTFRSHLAPASKRDRADLLALALARVALRAHERVGLLGAPEAPGHSKAILMRLANRILAHEGPTLPVVTRLPRYSNAVLFGDFFDTPADIAASLTPLAEAGVAGHVVQIVDPAEETLPYAGRVEFRDMAGPLKFLASRAEGLREVYAEKLTEHRNALNDLCRSLGWTFSIHRTDQSATAFLLMLHGMLSGSRDRFAAVGAHA